MSQYQNITGAKLVVTDELGLIVSFDSGEIKEASNYLERYTVAYQSGEDVLLRRIGPLDGDVPVAGLETENIAVRPSASNSATITTGPTVDVENDAVRLRRVVFNTELDEPKRQIDTRYLGITYTIATSVIELVAENPMNGFYVNEDDELYFLVAGGKAFEISITDSTPL